MQAFDECPPFESWQAAFEGQLPAEESRAYERHLESCTLCQRRLDTIQEDETEWRRLAGPGGDPGTRAVDQTLAGIQQHLRDTFYPDRCHDPDTVDLSF